MRRPGRVVVRRVDDSRELVRLPGPDRCVFYLADAHFSPDDELLVASYYRPDGDDALLQIWQLERR